ncbi:MAG: methyltransferase domain-containing protein [Deltaproteobacteria bacterium]|nr:methyltransferase domain-containing protein [Deltaproteobacteria bacterium]
MNALSPDRIQDPCGSFPARGRCRVCRSAFQDRPLLRYDNMPAVAQFLPDAASLERDRGLDLIVYQCPGCGLVQLDGDPVPYYRDVIRAASVSEEMRDFREKQFEAFTRRFSLGLKKVIEIGCGRGEFLSILGRFVQDSHGLEHLHESVAFCRGSGMRVSEGFVSGSMQELEHAPFDAFLMLNFLEHLPDPNATLRGICHNLAGDAVGLVEVPNFDMILKKNLFSEFTSDHLLYFTRETLGTALNLSGFEVLDCKEEWYQYILSATVRKRRPLDISPFQGVQARLHREIEEYLGAFSPGKVAVWGAGHQALAVLALMNLSGRIRYVVDSAAFKQGRFTPSTHIPIVSPERLDTDPVEAVIVVAASYSDEVAGILRRKYGGRIRVSILRDFGLEAV